MPDADAWDEIEAAERVARAEMRARMAALGDTRDAKRQALRERAEGRIGRQGLDAYARLTGEELESVCALGHVRRLRGLPDCAACGRPLRTAEARLCMVCGAPQSAQSRASASIASRAR